MIEWGGNVKTDESNLQYNGAGGDTMEIDRNIFSSLFNKKDNSDD
jgi:hypothetical protein